MGSTDRSKKRVHLWKKAAVHFLLCFVMGFFTGFAPTGKSSFPGISTPTTHDSESIIELAPRPLYRESEKTVRGLESEQPALSTETEDETENGTELTPRRQVIVVTPTNDRDPLRKVLLMRLASTLKLVPPPLLWIVVESNLENSGVSEMLRQTGVMYRHLVFKENFTDVRAETDFQRNLALKHIEHHRLSGIVHFAGLSNVYNLEFFDEIRAIGSLGAWPLAKLSARRKKPIIEGPVCQSSQVVGWHLNNPNVETEELDLHISSFGFNSSVLWDPERWGRLSSTEATKQNSLKFVKQAVVEDETKLKGVPPEDCSKVNLWQLHLSTKTLPVHNIPESELGGRQR